MAVCFIRFRRMPPKRGSRVGCSTCLAGRSSPCRNGRRRDACSAKARSRRTSASAPAPPVPDPCEDRAVGRTLEREESGAPSFRCDLSLQRFESGRVFAEEVAPGLIPYRDIALKQPIYDRLAQTMAAHGYSLVEPSPLSGKEVTPGHADRFGIADNCPRPAGQSLTCPVDCPASVRGRISESSLTFRWRRA